MHGCVKWVGGQESSALTDMGGFNVTFGMVGGSLNGPHEQTKKKKKKIPSVVY